ncbi:MAG: DUF1573 domain-containing protein [Ignavibacteriaceae bacterium]
MFNKFFYFVLIISSFILSSISFAQLIAPKISVQPMSYDFGNIREGDKVSHTFMITNNGGDLLEIKNVRASCGCTAAKPDKSELKPDESTQLKVEFDSSHKTGKQRKYVYVTTNDPENKELRIEFEGNVVSKDDSISLAKTPKIFLPETQHDFGKVKEGKVVDYTFQFINKGKAPLEIKDVKTSCGCTAALLSSKKIEPESEGTIKVELDTKNKSGKLTRTVAITSNDPEEPNKILTIIADVEKEKN